jgi:hypothetical protein
MYPVKDHHRRRVRLANRQIQPCAHLLRAHRSLGREAEVLGRHRPFGDLRNQSGQWLAGNLVEHSHSLQVGPAKRPHRQAKHDDARQQNRPRRLGPRSDGRPRAPQRSRNPAHTPHSSLRLTARNPSH